MLPYLPATSAIIDASIVVSLMPNEKKPALVQDRLDVQYFTV